MHGGEERQAGLCARMCMVRVRAAVAFRYVCLCTGVGGWCVFWQLVEGRWRRQEAMPCAASIHKRFLGLRPTEGGCLVPQGAVQQEGSRVVS